MTDHRDWTERYEHELSQIDELIHNLREKCASAQRWQRHHTGKRHQGETRRLADVRHSLTTTLHQMDSFAEKSRS